MIRAGRGTPFRFVLLMGFVNLFADMTYEGARSITGPYLAQLGASATVVGLVAGFGEFIGYSLRWLAGLAADRTRKYWPVTFLGYIVNMASVPLLGFVHSWGAAAALIVGERFGRAVRKPSTSAMLAHAGSVLGQGWVFGLNDALDQVGATLGPLIVALAVALTGAIAPSFLWLSLPAALTLAVLFMARQEYPHPERLSAGVAPALLAAPRAFWWLALAGAFWAAGFADFALIAYHLEKAHVLPAGAIPLTYAAAMLAGALAAPLFGRAFDRFGVGCLVAALAASLIASVMAFAGSALAAAAGVFLWGAALAAQDTVFPAALAKATPAERRASMIGAYGGIYGIAWFAGSALLGVLYDRSLTATIVAALALQIAALPFIMVSAARLRATAPRATPQR